MEIGSHVSVALCQPIVPHVALALCQFFMIRVNQLLRTSQLVRDG